MRNRIDHWCTVEPGNPKGKASFPTGTVDPWVGISLFPLNTNDGFSFISIFLYVLTPERDIRPVSRNQVLGSVFLLFFFFSLCNVNVSSVSSE